MQIRSRYRDSFNTLRDIAYNERTGRYEWLEVCE